MTSNPTVPTRRIRFPFGAQVLAGMAAGVVLGLVARSIPGGDANWLAQTLHTVGQSFVQLLKALVPPLVFTAIVGSIAALRDLNNAARLVTQTLLWFALTAFIAVVIGITLGLAIEPGLHAGVSRAAAAAPATTGSWVDFLKGLIPVNFLGLTAATTQADGRLSTSLSFNVLQIIVAAVAIGTAAVRIGAAGEAFLAFNVSALAIFRRLLRWVIALTPIGTAGLIGDAAVRYGWSALSTLGAFAGAVYLGLALVLLVVYPLILLGHGLSPLRFFASAWPGDPAGLRLALVGRHAAIDRGGDGAGAGRAARLHRLCRAAGRHHQDGRLCRDLPGRRGDLRRAVFRAGAAPGDYALIVLVSVFGSAATAGLTGATVMLTLTLSTLGLPLEGVGLLLAIDPILDMGRTAVNVAGQALVPTIVAKRAGILDLARFARGREASDDTFGAPLARA